MGRSFDRGGQSKKERQRGKRRAYRHALQDREAREAVAQAKRNNRSVVTRKTKKLREVEATPPATATPMNVVPLEASAPRPRTEQQSAGFFAKVIKRLFKKAA